MNEHALLISSRDREVWTYEEKRLLDRASRVIVAHGDRMQIVCGHPLCPDRRIQLMQDDTNPAGRILRCGHLDRHFARKLSH